MNFEHFVTSVSLELNSLDNTSLEYMEKIMAFSRASEKVFPEKMENFLRDIGLRGSLSQWSKDNSDLLADAREIELDPIEKNITIEFEDESIVVRDAEPVSPFLTEKLLLTPGTWQYDLALSYLCEESRLILYQVHLMRSQSN